MLLRLGLLVGVGAHSAGEQEGRKAGGDGVDGSEHFDRSR